jgi:UDP-GlcNAc:undecaprenyl-phosphate/decaprenyl-phosphate GlcNAc-1-phosphate transferase
MQSFMSTGLTTLFLTFALGACFTSIILKLASRLPRLARASSDRLHVAPTPVWGGVAIFLSFAFVASFRGLFNNREAIALAISASCMFFVGFLDDVRKLQPRWKLLGQILCALIPLWFLIRHPLTGNKVMDVLLGLFWMVGITNAFNLLDNINGLAGGTAVLASSFQAILFLNRGETVAALASIGFGGAIMGFLIFNFPKGRIFMGDSGSLFIGFWLAATTLVGTHTSGKNQLSSFLFPLLIMVVPICDTTLVTLTRMLRGRPVSAGGTDHLSHRLLAYGFSQTSAVLALWASTFLSGILAICAVLYGASTLLSVVIFLAVAVTLFGTYLTRFELKAQAGAPIADLPFHKIPGWVRISLRALLDLVLIIGSYYTAYLLRFSGGIDRSDMHLLMSTIVELALIKLAILVAFGAYRPWWDYFGLRDAYSFVGASTLASLTAVAYFSAVYRLYGFSRVVFALDFLVFTLLALILRFSFRLLDDIAPTNHRAKVLIYGANSDGETALQLVSKHYRFRVVGFLDDDHAMRDFSIHSVPVRGCTQDLARLAKQRDIRFVLLTPSATKDARNRLSALCKTLEIKLLSFHVTLEDLTAEVADSCSAEVSSKRDLLENEIPQPSYKAFSKAISS